jgi:hypothetical protein
MDKSIENLLRALLKKVAPDVELPHTKNGQRIDIESANKVDIYNNYISLLQEQVFVKHKRIQLLQSQINEQMPDAERYKILDDILDLKKQALDLDIEIQAKKYYTEIYTNRITHYAKVQEEIYKKAKVEISQLLEKAHKYMTLNKGVTDKQKKQLSGITHQLHTGVDSVAKFNQLYAELKDLINIIQNELNKIGYANII